MGKTSKWLRSFLGKKDKEKEKYPSNENPSTPSENPTTPVSIRHTPKEKKRWSFQRSSATATTPTVSYSLDLIVVKDNENKEKRQALAMATAADAAAQSAVAAIRQTEIAHVKASEIEEAAAIKIQSVFRSHLARKALHALRGLVKLQALVRGHLVRKQAKTTLRCVQALIMAQARARAQRIRMLEGTNSPNQWHPFLRKTMNEDRFCGTDHDFGRGVEKNVKIVEMDRCEYQRASKNMLSRIHDNVSPVPSAVTEISPRGCSSHFEDYTICTAESSPQDFSAVSKTDPSRIPFTFSRPECMEFVSFEYPMFPNYMANTESSRAKVRSQSAPKARPGSFERQASKRRASMEGKYGPRAERMQRSSSHVGCTAQNYQYALLMKLDRSSVSLKDSECGSTSTLLTDANYRSLAVCEV